MGRGASIRVCSIRPAEAHLGVLIQGSGPKIPNKDMGKLGAPVVLLPISLRRRVETEIVISLAGPAATALSLESGYVDTATDEARAVELADDLVRTAGLSKSEEKLLVHYERTAGPSDD